MRRSPRVAAALLLAGLLPSVAAAEDAGHASMRAALHEVETARRHLEEAKHDYRGHRPAAVEELRRAEEQIRRGLEKPAGTEAP